MIHGKCIDLILNTDKGQLIFFAERWYLRKDFHTSALEVLRNHAI